MRLFSPSFHVELSSFVSSNFSNVASKRLFLLKMNYFRRNCDSPSRFWLVPWNYVKVHVFQTTKRYFRDIWFVYSKPVPETSKEACLLLSVCLCVTISAGGLLYNWMFSSLKYTSWLSLATSTSFSLVLLLLLVFVHPVRCVLTISIPALGTKQGRRLLLSTCFLIITLDILPNVAGNIRIILKYLQCFSENSSESLLNSTMLLEQSAQEFGREVTKVSQHPYGTGLTFVSKVNRSTIRDQMLKVSLNIKKDFLEIETKVSETVLVANRIIACLFVVSLLCQSAWYLKLYLTDLKFNNIYITKKLKHLALKHNKAYVIDSSSKGLIESTGWKLSKEECVSCLLRIMVLSLFFVLIAMTIAIDHISFLLAVAIGEWANNFPTVPVILEIDYKVKISLVRFIELSTQSFHKKFQRDLSFISKDCVLLPTAPNNTLALTVALIYGIACAFIFFQTYAQRLCRRMSASFFEKQEDARIEHLFEEILRKHRKKQKLLL
ncbi:osteoclast stimulatory transmembrane protein [Ambystoma mexicanum]|uniref:osteoclast stimulatory transmembrane protein n=1 Tax=Ambystoma mexicanum TaxID=8296 RepID=UPI0037E7147B